MKNVYIQSVNPYGNFLKETTPKPVAAPIARVSRLRGSMVVMMGIFLLLNTVALKAQNCPTIGTTVVSANENTYYPGTQASVSAGATSITLGPIGSGANFGNTPIASGDILLVIQMQGAQFFLP